MAASKLKLPAIEQGATYSHTIRWMQPDQTTPMDISNCTAKMQVRETLESMVSIVDLDSNLGSIVLDTVTGSITLTLEASVTELLTPIKDALYDLELHYTSGRVVRLIEGKISIHGEVTR